MAIPMSILVRQGVEFGLIAAAVYMAFSRGYPLLAAACVFVAAQPLAMVLAWSMVRAGRIEAHNTVQFANLAHLVRLIGFGMLLPAIARLQNTKLPEEDEYSEA